MVYGLASLALDTSDYSTLYRHGIGVLAQTIHREGEEEAEERERNLFLE
jgi:hypothetical protein